MAELSIDDFQLLEREQNTDVGREVKVSYKARNERSVVWKGVVVQIVNENNYQVFFNDGQEIAEISRKRIQFY